MRVCRCLYADERTSEGILNFVVWRTYLWQTSIAKAAGGGAVLLLFETLYLDVSSSAITFAVHLMVVMHRSEVVAVAAGGLFALKAAGCAGSGGASSSGSGSGGGGHGREGGGECEGGSGGGLGEHREGATGGVGG